MSTASSSSPFKEDDVICNFSAQAPGATKQDGTASGYFGESNGTTRYNCELQKAMNKIEDLLAQQQRRSSEAQYHLNSLNSCNRQIAAELKCLQDACSTSKLVAPPSKEPSVLWKKQQTTISGNQTATSQKTGSTTSKGSDVSGSHVPSAVLEIAKTIEVDMDMVKEADGDIVDVPGWVGFVHSATFDMLVGSIIVANTVMMSLQLEVEGWKIKPRADECISDACTEVSNPLVDSIFLGFEHVFTALFAIELIVRLAADGIGYLRTPTNMCDALIVLISSFDSWVLTPFGKNETLSNVGVLRLLRLVRLAKVLRVVRVMKAFRSLRVLVSAVLASMGALAWSMTLLFVLMLMCAILMAQLVRPSIEEESRNLDSRMWLWDKFGTWYHAMLTVFEITMAPGGFINYRRLVTDVSPVMGVILVGYVCSVTFAVVRVITAMFLKATLSASDKDEAHILFEKTKKLEIYFTALQAALEKRHTENVDAPVGSIDEEDLKQLLTGPGMGEWLEMVGLNQGDALRLHNSMSKGTGRVSMADFVTVLLRMRGSARACELVVLLYETRSIADRLAEVEWRLGTGGPQSAHEPPLDIGIKPQRSTRDIVFHNV